MTQKGYAVVETAIVFPLFLMLVITLFFLLARFVYSGHEETKQKSNFMQSISIIDSVKRKAGIIYEIFEQ